jgi:hypothetical protein
MQTLIHILALDPAGLLALDEDGRAWLAARPAVFVHPTEHGEWAPGNALDFTRHPVMDIHSPASPVRLHAQRLRALTVGESVEPETASERRATYLGVQWAILDQWTPFAC